MRQASSQVQLSVQFPADLDLQRVDRWLVTYFGAPLLHANAIAGADVSAAMQSTPAYAMLVRLLTTCEMLCKACHLPCTEPGQVERLTHRAGHWDVSLLVPATNGLAQRVFEDLVRLGLRLINIFNSTEPSIVAAESLYNQLDRSALPRYRQLFPDGRANAVVAALARKLAVPFAHLSLGIMQLGYGINAQLTHRSTCLGDSAIGSRACSDKFFTSVLLGQAGFPVPVHELVTTEEEALKAAKKIGWPVVVKPANRERGEGVTVGVDTPDSLAEAFRSARSLSTRVLVEKQIPGLCHRIFVAGGRLVFATGRLPKSVNGDGIKTVRQLVDEANAREKSVPPWLRKKNFPLDELALTCLANAGLGIDSVPEEGQLVPLRPFETSDWGGVVRDATHSIHPDNVALAVRAARTLGLSVAGVDLITVDISRPWYESQAVINEVNFKPYISGSLDKETLHPYIHALVPDGGRIPIHAVIGSADLWSAAREVHQQLLKEGVRAHVTGHDRSESPSGEVVHIVSHGLFRRCFALLRSSDVEALVIVVDSDEFLEQGLPFDRLDRVHTFGDMDTGSAARLLKLLSRHL